MGFFYSVHVRTTSLKKESQNLFPASTTSPIRSKRTDPIFFPHRPNKIFYLEYKISFVFPCSWMHSFKKLCFETSLSYMHGHFTLQWWLHCTPGARFRCVMCSRTQVTYFDISKCTKDIDVMGSLFMQFHILQLRKLLKTVVIAGLLWNV
jgi:hypothetical protein